MGWRGEVEDRVTVRCQYCDTEWLHWSRKPGQRFGVCRGCAGEHGVTEGASKSAARAEQRRHRERVAQAKAVYALGGDPSILRVGTDHEEYVRGGDSYCRVCGPIRGDTPSPEFHADHYLPENP